MLAIQKVVRKQLWSSVVCCGVVIDPFSVHRRFGTNDISKLDHVTVTPVVDQNFCHSLRCKIPPLWPSEPTKQLRTVRLT